MKKLELIKRIENIGVEIDYSYINEDDLKTVLLSCSKNLLRYIIKNQLSGFTPSVYHDYSYNYDSDDYDEIIFRYGYNNDYIIL